MDTDDIFIKSFLEPIENKQQKKNSITQEERVICEEKKKKLAPIEAFLQKFVDLEVYVEHHEKYNLNTIKRDNIIPQLFSFYHTDSTKHFSPGISIAIDHPAIIEIAIPNNPLEEGVVIFKVGSSHKDAYLLENSFHSYENACSALGRFLLNSTVKVGKDPKKYIKEVAQRKQTHISKDDSHELENDISFNKNNVKYEEPKLKNDSNGSPLKKISNLFSNAKNDDDDD